VHQFTATIKQFDSKGEKTGWSYVEIPADIAEALSPGQKTAFRVKGKLDHYKISGVSLVPMGAGLFILPINGEMRKATRKRKGAMLNISLSPDLQDKPLNEELLTCLSDDPAAKSYFDSLPRGHQRYFSNWIDAAKTEATRVKRLTICVSALSRKMDYGEMIREGRRE